MSPTSYPARPALTLRIGITGTRALDSKQTARLSEQLNAFLDAARHEMERLAKRNEDVGRAYVHPPGETPVPVLRFVSPLARGADRLAAREALKLGYALHVPMPFSTEEYEKDFVQESDRKEFYELLERASGDWLELDGSRAEQNPQREADEKRAYEAVGRYVVRHCEILIAIWDGINKGERGGTSEIVRFAAIIGIPVLWLHAIKDDHPPRWITDILDLRHPPAEPKDFGAALREYLTLRIPPPLYTPSRHQLVDRVARLGQKEPLHPEAIFFGERKLRSRRAWRMYSWLIRLASGSNPPWTPPRPPHDPTARYWFDRYEPVDARAGEYAGRYRSAYIWQVVFGALAVIFGAFTLIFNLGFPVAGLEPLAHFSTVLEFFVLFFIVLLVLFGASRDWHERSIEYRLFAELCRKQQALAPLGWALPIVAAAVVAPKDRHDHAAWVGWLFAAEQRAAPFPRGELAVSAKGASRTAVLEELIAEQQSYHTARLTMADGAGKTLENLGTLFFLAVFAAVILKILFMITGIEWLFLMTTLAFIATVLPAVSAAFIAIRAYAELELLAAQSEHMLVELKRAHDRVQRLDADSPFLSQDIGIEASAVATLMLQDLDGWAQLFRVKGVELG